MTPVLATSASAISGLILVAMLGVLACGIGLFALLWDWKSPEEMAAARTVVNRDRAWGFIEKEKDIAAALAITPRVWIGSRVGFSFLLFLVGLWSGVWLLYIVGPIVGWTGVRFVLQGRVANRRLRRERAFLGQLRNLRDRMAISNQSLDTALQELGRRPGKDLEYVLGPLARGGSVVQNIVDVGLRSRSPIIEYAMGVLLWARTRSLESLIDAIDGVLIPVSEAQLAVQEESQITLAQQRFVTFTMIGLMSAVFLFIIRIPLFADYYKTTMGNIVLFIVIVIFLGLVWLLNVIVKVTPWTRWDLPRLAKEQERLGA